jgi:hypothetical protein
MDTQQLDQLTTLQPTWELPQIPSWLHLLADLATAAPIVMVLTFVLLGLVWGDMLRPFDA